MCSVMASCMRPVWRSRIVLPIVHSADKKPFSWDDLKPSIWFHLCSTAKRQDDQKWRYYQWKPVKHSKNGCGFGGHDMAILSKNYQEDIISCKSWSKQGTTAYLLFVVCSYAAYVGWSDATMTHPETNSGSSVDRETSTPGGINRGSTRLNAFFGAVQSCQCERVRLSGQRWWRKRHLRWKGAGGYSLAGHFVSSKMICGRCLLVLCEFGCVFELCLTIVYVPMVIGEWFEEANSVLLRSQKQQFPGL